MSDGNSSLSTHYRTHTCNELRPADSGKKVVLSGWVNRRRNHGGLIFIDLRDRYGKSQVVFNPEAVSAGVLEQVKSVRMEDVIRAGGEVQSRPDGMKNPDLPTGEIEVRGDSIEILSRARTTPFVIASPGEVQEDLRYRYRYLDLRRPELQRNLEVRHGVVQASRRALNDLGFLEIETPILTKSTPEGARDYLVPSRVHPHKFYALPQSPQLYKQLLMISGLDRYYQIARCFRDEDLRADRQPEFTQIDIEMSYVAEEDVMRISEILVASIFHDVAGLQIETPFRRMTFQDAMEHYGTDRPDLRFDLLIRDLTASLTDTDFGVFKTVIGSGGRVRGVAAPQGNTFSRKELDALSGLVSVHGGKGLLWVRKKNERWEGMPVKYTGEEVFERIWEENGLSADDILLMMAGSDEVTGPCLAEIRLHLAKKFELRDDDSYKFTWVVDYPLFGLEEESKAISSQHHPFTSPRLEDVDRLGENPLAVMARAYDLVLNGNEIGGGSIRISDCALQEKIFRVLGIGEVQAKERFGFFLEALEYGTPPHGGIAFGLDRLVMLVTGEDSIREVIAFPKTTSAYALCEGSPSQVSREALKELRITLTDTTKKKNCGERENGE